MAHAWMLAPDYAHSGQIAAGVALIWSKLQKELILIHFPGRCERFRSGIWFTTTFEVALQPAAARCKYSPDLVQGPEIPVSLLWPMETKLTEV